MTGFGKTLVLLTVALSLAFCGYAVVVFMYPIDWGWDPKYAPKEGGQTVPSRFTQRDEALKKLAQAKAAAIADWAAASHRLALAETDVAQRQYEYAQALARVQAGPDIIIRDLQKTRAGDYEKDPDTGRPVFGDKVGDKTFAGYLKELNEVLGQIEQARKKVTTMLTQEAELTEQLNGKTDPDTMKKTSKGLYDLIAHEVSVRKQAEAELEELQPGYFQELVDSQLFLDRQKQLLERIKELEGLGQRPPQP
jgi:hypothetical protein